MYLANKPEVSARIERTQRLIFAVIMRPRIKYKKKNPLRVAVKEEGGKYFHGRIIELNLLNVSIHSN